jgi:FAD/FMN-containing dehydrogenase
MAKKKSMKPIKVTKKITKKAPTKPVVKKKQAKPVVKKPKASPAKIKPKKTLSKKQKSLLPMVIKQSDFPVMKLNDIAAPVAQEMPAAEEPVSETPWLERLKAEFKGDIATDEETLKSHSRDASVFEVKPTVVVFPKTYEDVEFLVNFVNKEKKAKLSLTPRAAGTDMSGGPLTESISVSFTKYINHIKKLEPTTATVEPGLYYRDLEKEMDKIGVAFPSYPASKGICAWGGIIANNSGGEKTLTYTQTLNHVTRIKAVLADGKTYDIKKLTKKELDEKMKMNNFEGKLYKNIFNICEQNYDIIKAAEPQVSKNSTGYFLWRVWDRDKQEFDLTKLFVGSQGTLGIWLDADINLVKKHNYARLVTIYLDNLGEMTDAIHAALKYNPESLESFDINTLRLGLKYLPDLAKKANQGTIPFMWGFRREAWRALFHGLPVFVILVELTGDSPQEVQKKVNDLCADLKKKKLPHLAMKNEKQGQKYWVMRRESFGLLRTKIKDRVAAAFVDDFCVKPDYLAEFLPQFYALLKEYNIMPTLAGHAGDGNFHIIPLMDLSKPEEREKIPIVLEKFTALVLKYHGTIAAEHNDGLIRSDFVELQYGPKIIKLFEEVKDAFDPKGIFNPGKKVRSSKAFAKEHMRPN